MDILKRIQEIIAAEPNESQLDKFLADLRDSLASSNKQFVTYSILILTALATYHLVVYEGASGVSFNTIQISNTSLFRRVFLVFPAALLAAMACISYLRKIQRAVYDYLTISRYRVLGQTGLHELRIPADYILGLNMLSNEGGSLGKVIGNSVAFLLTFIFAIGPAVYVISEATINLKKFGASDITCLFATAVVFALSLCSLAIIILSGRIKG